MNALNPAARLVAAALAAATATLPVPAHQQVLLGQTIGLPAK